MELQSRRFSRSSIESKWSEGTFNCTRIFGKGNIQVFGFCLYGKPHREPHFLIFFIFDLQAKYQNETLKIDICANNRKVETDYALSTVNVFLETNGPCGGISNGNYKMNSSFAFSSLFLISLLIYLSCSPCVNVYVRSRNNILRNLRQSSGTINVEVRLVCKETESRSISSDVSKFNFVRRSFFRSSFYQISELKAGFSFIRSLWNDFRLKCFFLFHSTRRRAFYLYSLIRKHRSFCLMFNGCCRCYCLLAAVMCLFRNRSLGFAFAFRLSFKPMD